MERLQKVLANAGVGSRRFCEKLIADGKVCVDGNVITGLGTKVDESSVIQVNGKVIKKIKNNAYILLNKPVGYTCTRKDPHAKKTILDIIDDSFGYIYPAGRLDVNTSGLIVLTNDGDFAHLLTHPSHILEKTYIAKVKNIPNDNSLDILRKGVMLEDGKTSPAKVKIISIDKKMNTADVEIVIHEGKKRQVRRMFDAVGSNVLELKRTKIGPIEIGELKTGKYRQLTREEIEEIRNFCKAE
ncbi:MAG: pseudouridine synthase [Armatimonadota bacterium]